MKLVTYLHYCFSCGSPSETSGLVVVQYERAMHSKAIPIGATIRYGAFVLTKGYFLLFHYDIFGCICFYQMKLLYFVTVLFIDFEDLLEKNTVSET